MGRLFFTIDGELRERAPGAQPRVVARVVRAQGEGSRTRLLCGRSEHAIVPLASHRHAFELHDRDERASGGFEPFRLRRGGRLRLGKASVAMHGRPWSHEGWVLSTPGGSRVDATVVAAGEDGEPQVRTGASVGPSVAFAVVLDPVGGAGPAEELAVAPELLILGCWLIARWHRSAPGDHVLAALAA